MYDLPTCHIVKAIVMYSDVEDVEGVLMYDLSPCHVVKAIAMYMM